MKKFIYKTNQYLLERYPTIWNTRLVWMLLSAIILHLIFFVFGFFTLTNPETLHERRVTQLFFTNGSAYLSVIISILILVAWVIFLFKNNGFKNFYPTSKLKLFGQFFCYLIIIICTTTFYLSYNYGMKAYISSTYSDEKISNEINSVNNAALFFTEKIETYTLDKRRYPKPFYELYCETSNELIIDSLPRTSFLSKDYQFFTLKTKEIPLDQRYFDEEKKGFIYSQTKDSTIVYYFKDNVVDPSTLIKTPAPSYYNYSSTFYISKNDTLTNFIYNYNYDLFNSYDYDYDYNYDYDYVNNYNSDFSLRNQLSNKNTYELLQRNDAQEIKKILSDVISISNRYKVKHNLSPDQWFDIIYHPENFEVNTFIRDREKSDYDYLRSDSYAESTEFEKFFSKNLSDFYFEHDNLKNVFENIENVKASTPLSDSIHFFIWMSFFIAAIIFMFRVTGLKQLLFSIITVGVLTLLISLLTALLISISRSGEDGILYFISYFALCIATIILVIPIFYADKIKKTIVAICVNISITGFVFYLLLILSIISMHQRDYCDAHYTYDSYRDCFTVFDIFEFNWSWVLFFSGIIFIFFYTKVIKNWKSLPEG